MLMLVYLDTVWIMFRGQGRRLKFKRSQEENVSNVVGATSSDGF